MRKWFSHSLDGVLMVFCSPGQSPCKLFLFPLDVVWHPSLFAFNILIFSLKQLWNSKMYTVTVCYNTVVPLLSKTALEFQDVHCYCVL